MGRVINSRKKELFFSHVRKIDGGCWIWTASVNHSGYGKFADRPNKYSLAHRISWEIVNGEIKDGLCVLHSCDNPPCVNPFHLRLGTRDDNAKDAAKRFRKGKKIGPEQAVQIRALAGKFTQKQIGEIYGLSQATVGRIISGHLWAYA